MPNKRNFGIWVYSSICISTALLTFTILQVAAHSHNKCHSCFYEGPQLKDVNAYPCMKHYKAGQTKQHHHKEEVEPMGMEECHFGETLCYYHLTLQTVNRNNKTGEIDGGCFLERSRKCLEDAGAKLSLDDGGTCYTFISPTVEEFIEMERCIDTVDYPRGVMNPEDYPDYNKKQNHTVCVCSGAKCNGPTGPFKPIH